MDSLDMDSRDWDSRDLTALTRADFPVLRPVATRWMDNDVYGHVNNAVYYSYFDTAVNGYLMETTGLDVRALPAIGVVAETRCRYLHEVSFPDVLLVGLAVPRLGNSSVTYRLGLFRGERLDPAALGHFVHVYVDHQTRRVVPVPTAIQRAVAALV